MRLNYKCGEESLLGGHPPWRDEHGRATCNINTQICDKHNSKLRCGKEVVVIRGTIYEAQHLVADCSGLVTGMVA